MAKKVKVSKQKTVVFNQDFATKKSGDKYTCDSMEARLLVDRKVAEYATTEQPAAVKVEADETKVKTSKKQKK
jgi:hypothetical protein